MTARGDPTRPCADLRADPAGRAGNRLHLQPGRDLSARCRHPRRHWRRHPRSAARASSPHSGGGGVLAHDVVVPRSSASPEFTSPRRRSSVSLSSISTAVSDLAAAASSRPSGSPRRPAARARREPCPTWGPGRTGTAATASFWQARHGYRGDGAFGRFAPRPARTGTGHCHHIRGRGHAGGARPGGGSTCSRPSTVRGRRTRMPLCAGVRQPEVPALASTSLGEDASWPSGTPSASVTWVDPSRSPGAVAAGESLSNSLRG